MSTRSKHPHNPPTIQPGKGQHRGHFCCLRVSVSTWPSRVSRHGRQQQNGATEAARADAPLSYLLSLLRNGCQELSDLPVSSNTLLLDPDG